MTANLNMHSSSGLDASAEPQGQTLGVVLDLVQTTGRESTKKRMKIMGVWEMLLRYEDKLDDESIRVWEARQRCGYRKIANLRHHGRSAPRPKLKPGRDFRSFEACRSISSPCGRQDEAKILTFTQIYLREAEGQLLETEHPHPSQ